MSAGIGEDAYVGAWEGLGAEEGRLKPRGGWLPWRQAAFRVGRTDASGGRDAQLPRPDAAGGRRTVPSSLMISFLRRRYTSRPRRNRYDTRPREVHSSPPLILLIILLCPVCLSVLKRG